MLNSLNSGVAGLHAFQQKLDVIGNNIANSNTVAYKSARTTFADAFSQTLQGGGDASGALQIGSGVMTAAITTEFAQGSYQNTGRDEDVFIDGEGFFIVKNLDGDSFATRAGDFFVNNQGYLVTGDGFRVQGYSNQVAPGATFSTRGDIRIWDDPNNRPVPSDPLAEPRSYKINTDGRVRMHLSDGVEYDCGQILLQKFTDKNQLRKEGNNLYSNLLEAGPLGGDVASAGEPNSNGLGKLESGALEMSNVDLAGEFAELITTQRGFQANARIITTSDEVLQEVVNLKR